MHMVPLIERSTAPSLFWFVSYFTCGIGVYLMVTVVLLLELEKETIAVILDPVCA